MGKKTNSLVFRVEDAEEIFLTVSLKIKELLMGEHQSKFTGVSGFDFSSIREKRLEDPPKKIDWAKSTLTGFDPLMIREVVEERTVEVIIVADASLSTFFGINGSTIGQGIMKVIAVVGFSAAILQDPVAQLVFNNDKFNFESHGRGKDHILYLLALYQNPNYTSKMFDSKDLSKLVLAEIERTSLVVFVSDFLSPEAINACRGLVDIASSNDVVVIVVDSSSAFDLPRVSSSSWITCWDQARRKRKVLSRRELGRLKFKVSVHQAETASAIEKMGLDVLYVDPSSEMFYDDVLSFFLNRVCKT